MATFTLDGLNLNDSAGRWMVERGTGLQILPARAGGGSNVPGRDGIIPAERQTFDPGSVPLSLVVTGDDTAAVEGSLELLLGVLGQRHKLLQLVKDYGNGQKRAAAVQVAGSVEPAWLGPGAARLSTVLTVPGAFWRDLNPSDSTASLPAASSATSNLSALAGCTAPVSDALLLIPGGWSEVSLSDPVGGDQLTVQRAVPAGSFVLVDPVSWRARLLPSSGWSMSAGSDISADVVSNRGRGSMFTLAPEFSTGAGRVRLSVTGAGRAGASNITVRARRAFF